MIKHEYRKGQMKN